MKTNITWTIDRIKELLEASDKMVIRSLLKLYDYQTFDEQASEITTHQNSVGFNSVDAGFLTSCANWYNTKGFLSIKQLTICRKKLMKYSGQLTTIANNGGN